MTTVYVDMVGDLFHAGHVQFLKKAASFGERLIVGVNSDKDVESYKRVPIISCENRAVVIKELKCVYKVIAPCPLIITKEFMKKHKIDLVVHAHDEGDTNYNFMYNIPIKLGKFKRIDYDSSISTTQIIKRCQE